jgi:small conductance mechanosensitive channel
MDWSISMEEMSLGSLQTLFTTYAVRVIGVFILLAIAWLVSAWVRRAVVRSLERASFDPTLTKFFGSAARWAVLLVAGLACLGVFGVETTSFAAVLGASGIAIGLAFQGALSNFAAGVMLLVFRPFQIGQFVNMAGVMGTVDAIGLFTTTVDTPDNRRIVLPNSSIFGTTIENISHHDVRRADVDVGVDYGASIDRTREVLERAAANVPGRTTDKDVQVVLTGLGASSVDWQVRVWAPSADFLAVKEATIRAVKNALDEAAIGIPFPQRDVHLYPAGEDGSSS